MVMYRTILYILKARDLFKNAKKREYFAEMGMWKERWLWQGAGEGI